SRRGILYLSRQRAFKSHLQWPSARALELEKESTPRLSQRGGAWFAVLACAESSVIDRLRIVDWCIEVPCSAVSHGISQHHDGVTHSAEQVLGKHPTVASVIQPKLFKEIVQLTKDLEPPGLHAVEPLQQSRL